MTCSIIRILVPNVTDEAPRLFVPSLKVLPCQADQAVRHLRLDNIDVFFGHVTDALIFDSDDISGLECS